MSTEQWSNWADLHRETPKRFFRPQNEGELRGILAAAFESKETVRFVGFGHSPSDLAATPGYMISLEKFENVVSVDQKAKTITVQGGTQISTINEVLSAYGLSLPCQGSVSEPTIAGAMGTGTHGTGLRDGIISTAVLGVKIMLANGQIVSASHKESPELFKASLCHLGTIGALLEVTIQCVDAFDIDAEYNYLRFDDFLERPQFYAQSNDYVRLNWFPHTKYAMFYTGKKVERQYPLRKDTGRGMNVINELIGYYFLELCLFIGSFLPFLLPLFSYFFFWFEALQKIRRRNRSDRIYNFDCKFKQRVQEWAIPMSEVSAVLREYEQFISTSGCKVHFPVEIRFVRGDSIWLSPSHGQDSCYLNIIAYRPFGRDINYAPYFSEFEAILMRHGGRPHWAKDFQVSPQYLKSSYKHWDDFWRVQKEVDPTGMFLNDRVKSFLGR